MFHIGEKNKMTERIPDLLELDALARGIDPAELGEEEADTELSPCPPSLARLIWEASYAAVTEQGEKTND